MAETLTVDEIQVLITASTSEFTKQMEQVKAQLGTLAKSAESSSPRISAAMIATGNIIANVFAKAFHTAAASMDDAISRLDTLNNFPRVMGNLGISAENAQVAINYLSEKLKGLPTALNEAANYVQRLVSANNNLNASTRMYLAMNDAIIAGGADAQKQQSAMEQLTQAYSKGAFEANEWKSVLEAAPAQLKQVANAFGYTSTAIGGDFYEALKNGEISMNQFMAKMVELDKKGVNGLGSFREQAEAASGGVATSIANMKTALVRGLTEIMNAIGQTNIASFFNAVSRAIGTAANYIAAFVKVVLQAVNAIRGLFGQSAISFGGTASAASSAANSVSGIGDAANSATDAIGGTSKAAKKLQKQLAGFDEMTVLRSTDTSGSGGGTSTGGVGGVGDLAGLEIELDVSGLEKAEDQVEKIAKQIRKTLEDMFDFDKIKKAIKRFGDDVGKFLKPVGKILDDVWNDYLKPFISWTGNDLLPAFFNALGGAINLLGQVIGALWDNALKPFIDFFLKPIAEFTGGIIVGVLNAIGDGLRAIAENQLAVDIIAGIAAGIGAAVLAYQAYEVVMGAVNALELLHQGILGVSTTATGAYALGVNLMTGAYSAATTAAGLMSSAMELIPFVAVGAAVAAVVIGIGIFGDYLEETRRKTETLHGSTEAYLPVLDESAEKYDKNKDGVLSYKESLERLDSALYAQNDAELKMINTQKSLAEKTKTLKEYADKYGVSVDDLISLHKTGQLQTIASGEEYDKLREATINVEQATSEVRVATEKYNEEQGNLQSIANQTKEQYDALGKKMVESAEKGGMATTEWYQQEIELQRLREEIDSTGKNVGEMTDWYSQAVEAGTKLGKGLEDGYTSKVPDIQRSGFNLGQGAINGINSKWQETYNAGWNQADAGIKGFNDRARIKSPSRVMMESGGFFSEGVAIGMQNKVGDVAASAAAIADAANISFDSRLDTFQDDLFSFAVGGTTDFTELFENNAQTRVIVKIGEETLIDKIVDGINDRSELIGTSVINV